MKKVESDKTQLPEPTEGYDLQRAVMDTNEAVQQVASLMRELTQSVAALTAAVRGGGTDGGDA